MNASLEPDHCSEEGEATAESSLLTDDKGLTFRKRRLSLTNLRQLANNNGKDGKEKQDADNGDDDDDDDDDDPFAFQCPTEQSTPPEVPNPRDEAHDDENGDDKVSSFRKRRLSLTQNRGETENSSHDEGAEPPNQRRRRASDASQSSMDSGQHRLKSRTVHAAELLAQPPPSPSVHQLYQQKTAPPQRKSIELVSEQQPKWKKRHTRHLHEDEKTLPFPRDIVGTFSCHGVEPMYEDEYVLEEDEDGEWVPHAASHDTDKPTTAAKINQDRGGVAFPYGNCSRTALFAVYDGEIFSFLAFRALIDRRSHSLSNPTSSLQDMAKVESSWHSLLCMRFNDDLKSTRTSKRTSKTRLKKRF